MPFTYLPHTKRNNYIWWRVSKNNKLKRDHVYLFRIFYIWLNDAWEKRATHYTEWIIIVYEYMTHYESYSESFSYWYNPLSLLKWNGYHPSVHVQYKSYFFFFLSICGKFVNKSAQFNARPFFLFESLVHDAVYW